MKTNNVVSLARVFLLLAWFACPAAMALDTGDIVVVNAKGEVRVTMSGAVRAVRAGSVLELPATVSTGRDGSIELKQGATTVSVGPDTLLDFPALERRGAPIDRIQQPRGNAFYSIGKREGRKLRVETPYLVGVVKGTQFNVSTRDEATTISLFEGLLEIRAADESSVIDIKAGEIASLRRGDRSINVIKMDSGKLPTPAPRAQGSGEGSGGGNSERGGSAAVVRSDGSGGSPVGLVATNAEPASAPGISGSLGAEERTPVAVGGDAGVTLSDGNAAGHVTANVAVGDAAGVNAGVSLSAGNGVVTADVATGAAVAVGPVDTGLSTSTGVDVSASGVAVDSSTSVGLAAGTVAADVSVGTGIDVGSSGVAADVGLATGVSGGPVAADTGVGAAVDLGSGGSAVDVTSSTAVDAGPVSVGIDTGTAVAVDTGGTVALDTGAALDVANTPVAISAGVSAGVDLGSGTVDLGVAVVGVDLGVGIDLGLGDDAQVNQDTPGNTTPPTTPTTPDVGGLLDSLLRRPGRR